MNLDNFKKPYSVNGNVADDGRFDIRLLDTIIGFAREMEKYLKTDPNKAFGAARKLLEAIVIAATYKLPKNVLGGYIRNPKHRARYENGKYNISFSEMMDAAQNEHLITDETVIKKMFHIYGFCSSEALHFGLDIEQQIMDDTASENNSADVSKKITITFSEAFEEFKVVYSLISKLIGQNVPPVDVNKLPIDGYSVVKKYKASAYGDETGVYLARNEKNTETVIIYEYSRESEKTTKGIKVEQGALLANTMRSEDVRSLLKAEAINQDNGYGDSYYMIYGTSSVDERLDKAIKLWRNQNEDSLENALKIGSCLLTTLQALKRSKIHHRNICPENIFISYDDMFAQLTNIGMVKFDSNVGESLSKLAQDTSNTLRINDYGMDYFTKNSFTPKGMHEIYNKGVGLENINWEVVDIYSVIKVISACYSEDGLKDQIEYEDNEAAKELFKTALAIDKLTYTELQKDYNCGFTVEKILDMVENALDQCLGAECL